MKQPSKFKKSNFYIILVCNYGTVLSSLAVLLLSCFTVIMFFIFKTTIPIYLYLLHTVLGYIYYIYSNQGMLKAYPKRRKMYDMLVNSIETNRPFKKSMVYDMMYTICEEHIVKVLEKNYGVKLV